MWYSPGNVSIDRRSAQATKLIETTLRVYVCTDDDFSWRKHSCHDRTTIGSISSKSRGTLARRDTGKHRREERHRALATRLRRRVVRLRGSIFLVVFCCRWATHHDRSSQNSNRNHNGRLSVLGSSYEAVNSVSFRSTLLVFDSLPFVPRTRAIRDPAFIL